VRGFFGVGAVGISKAMNAGAIFRTAHAFGASFVFTVAAVYARDRGGLADTSDTPASVPFYACSDLDSMLLPAGCSLVGVELAENAVELPSFRHPKQAAYLLGPERGSLAPELMARCDHVIKIPTQFCVNVSVTAALVMYDRVQSMGRFAPRPVAAGGPIEAPPEHVAGGPRFRQAAAFRATPPDHESA